MQQQHGVCVEIYRLFFVKVMFSGVCYFVLFCFTLFPAEGQYNVGTCV
jgi:hypothetical protein